MYPDNRSPVWVLLLVTEIHSYDAPEYEDGEDAKEESSHTSHVSGSVSEGTGGLKGVAPCYADRSGDTEAGKARTVSQAIRMRTGMQEVHVEESLFDYMNPHGPGGAFVQGFILGLIVLFIVVLFRSLTRNSK